MKYLVYILIVITSFSGCNAQKSTKMEQDIIIPEITNEFEKFDIEAFNNEVDSISKKRIIITSEKYLVERAYSSGYLRREFHNNSFFKLVKKFNKEGLISEKAVLFNNGYPIGPRYIFNEKGKLTEEIDTDKGYNFGWKDILEYCHKNNIKLTKGYPKSGGVHTEIYKIEEEGEKVWQITYYDYKEEQLLEVVLDGKNGKELKRRKLEFIGG